MNCYDRQARMLRCAGCGLTQALHSHSLDNPERFVATILEPFLQEHAKCAGFKNQRKAQAHIRWQREMRKVLPFRKPPPGPAPRRRDDRKLPDKLPDKKTAEPIERPDVDIVVARAQIEALAKRWGARLI